MNFSCFVSKGCGIFRMNSAYKRKINITVFFFLLSIITFTATSLDAHTRDRWTGKDKLEHLGVSAFYTVFAYKFANHHLHYSKNNSLKLSVGFTFSLGSFKELYDSKHPEQTSSLKDLTADVIGIAFGIFVVTR